MKLCLSYTIFAVLATIANIGSQEFFIRIHAGRYSIAVSILMGTGTGLFVKYLLDKKFIFRYRADTLTHEFRTFTLYIMMGVLTTGIFWGFEFGFEYLFHDKVLRYIGGTLGLAIGFWIKYQLDKRYVFTENIS